MLGPEFVWTWDRVVIGVCSLACGFTWGYYLARRWK